MTATRNISQQIRFLFTAVTLLCVLLLNNQEITTYRPVVAKANSEANTHLNSTKNEKTVVKQKVTFEAVTSYFILQPVFFTQWFYPTFFAPVSNAQAILLESGFLIHFFSVLFGFTIIPNAP